MGAVYAAHDESLSRDVALKVLSPDLADDESYRRRFEQEALLLAALDSPYVVGVHDFGQEAGRLFLATQFFPDGDLRRRLTTEGAPPRVEAISLVIDVVRGLADAHAAGIVHRDIKPSNVLLRRRRDRLHAVLSDFGIARMAQSDLTRPGTVIGTYAYMAPELHEGGAADELSDVYSVGCLLYAVVTGRAPYEGTDIQVALAHANAPVPTLESVDPFTADLNDVLQGCLAKSPAGRFQSAQAIEAALQHVGSRVADEQTTVRRAIASPDAEEHEPPSLSATEPAPAPRTIVARTETLPTALDDTPTSTGSRTDSHVTAAAASPPSRRRRWVVLAVAAVLVFGVTAGAVAYANRPLNEAELGAVQLVASSTEEQLFFDESALECAAEELVRTHGLEELQARGLLTESGEFGPGWDRALGVDFLRHAVDCDPGWPAALAERAGDPAAMECLEAMDADDVVRVFGALLSNTQSGDETLEGAFVAYSQCAPLTVEVEDVTEADQLVDLRLTPGFGFSAEAVGYVVESSGRVVARSNAEGIRVRLARNGKRTLDVRPVLVAGLDVESAPSPVRVETYGRPGKPTARVTSGYRSFRLTQLRSKPDGRAASFYEVRATGKGSSWEQGTVRSGALVVTTREGGQTRCVLVRAVASPYRSKASRFCGTSEPKTLSFFLRGTCDDEDYDPCRDYALVGSGYAPFQEIDLVLRYPDGTLACDRGCAYSTAYASRSGRINETPWIGSSSPGSVYVSGAGFVRYLQ